MLTTLRFFLDCSENILNTALLHKFYKISDLNVEKKKLKQYGLEH